MAVYTEVNEADLASFLGDYDLGHMLALKGIAEGVENSNYFLHADAGYFILTLYEKRVAEKDLPFFLGLMEHLAGHGLNCPQPVKNRHGGALGRIAGRPAARAAPVEPGLLKLTGSRSAPRLGRGWDRDSRRGPPSGGYRVC